MVKISANGKVSFQTHEPEAGEVYVMGNFNDWNDSRHPMKKGKNGMWSVDITLAPGEYEFLYFIDRRAWKTDDTTPHIVNAFGTENSIVTVPPRAKTTKKAPAKKAKKK